MGDFFSFLEQLQLDVVRMWLGYVLCVVGAVLCVIGAIGVLRFPDFYSRLHAASIIDTGGVFALLIGMMLISPAFIVVFKLILICLFIVFTAPTSVHAIANAAYTAGLEPLIGDEEEREAQLSGEFDAAYDDDEDDDLEEEGR